MFLFDKKTARYHKADRERETSSESHQAIVTSAPFTVPRASHVMGFTTRPCLGIFGPEFQKQALTDEKQGGETGRTGHVPA